MEKISRHSPAIAKLLDRYPLTENSSSKETWHVILDVSGCNFDYHPGDSVGIFPENDPVLVDHLIEAMETDPTSLVTSKKTGEEMSLHTFLSKHANLSRITSSFLKLVHECETCPQSLRLLGDLFIPENKPKLKEYLSSYDPLHLLREFGGVRLPLQEVCNQFSPLLPRFYSIASSRYVNPTTIDLTVAIFTWTQGNEKRYGVASHFLCHIAIPHETPIPFYVQPAPQFRLPQNHSTDIIMIGPGTGIAPFRAFLQERIHYNSAGKHWLFFGERNKNSDFFYREDFSAMDNLRIHTAFSRDQEEKVYVQHKMLENAKDLFTWLEGGAHLYVCGDAKVMARDVDKTLHQIVETEGNLDPECAIRYVKQLKKAGRYLLDVY